MGWGGKECCLTSDALTRSKLHKYVHEEMELRVRSAKRAIVCLLSVNSKNVTAHLCFYNDVFWVGQIACLITETIAWLLSQTRPNVRLYSPWNVSGFRLWNLTESCSWPFRSAWFDTWVDMLERPTQARACNKKKKKKFSPRPSATETWCFTQKRIRC